MKKAFLQLVRLGVGENTGVFPPDHIDWPALFDIAAQQSFSSVVLDGIEKLPIDQRPQKELLFKWIGVTYRDETQYAIQWKSATELAHLLANLGIRVYVLKGAIVSECYPVPQHRNSVDLDCFLLPKDGERDVWEEGNKIIEEKGYIVKRDYYKNSTWILPGLTVENHKWLTPFRGNKRLTALERLLQNLIRNDAGNSRFEGTWLYRPPVMVSALFLIEHAYSHFLHEGLTWRHVLDWMMFCRKHQEDINWQELDRWLDQFRLRKFYNTYTSLGKFMLGEASEFELTDADKLMLTDIWAPLDIHETVNGIRGKLTLVGNTWRARWKYREFTDMFWIKALWIQVKGFMFIKEPKIEDSTCLSTRLF